MKVTFDSKNKAKSFNDFPKFTMDYKEKARIALVEPAPEAGYTHTLKSLRIVNGEVEMKSVKNKDGSYSQVPETDFIGRHMCFGNIEKLDDGKGDPENCLTCAASKKDDNIGYAQRRFAIHIIHYKTHPGSSKIQEPFSADLKVWAFANKAFDTLLSIMEEHPDAAKRDLLVTCESKMYQTMEIAVGGDSEWMKDDTRKQFVKALYENNKIDDLSVAIARKITKEQAQEDIDKVLEKSAQARQANTGGSAQQQVAEAPTLDVGTLLDEAVRTEAPAEIPAAPLPDPTPPVLPEPSAPAEEPAAEEKPAEAGAFDFDAMLADL